MALEQVDHSNPCLDCGHFLVPGVTRCGSRTSDPCACRKSEPAVQQIDQADAADRIADLEIRCRDKDASIAQLIEQLQKAEAQNAATNRTEAHE